MKRAKDIFIEELRNKLVCSPSRYDDLIRHAPEQIEVVSSNYVSDSKAYFVNKDGIVSIHQFELDEVELTLFYRNNI